MPKSRHDLAKTLPRLLPVVFLLLALGATLFARTDSRRYEHLYAQKIEKIARKHGLDPLLVRAVIYQESKFDRFACGSYGEYGLMQIRPSMVGRDWAKAHKKREPTEFELFSVNKNLEIGCWYLAKGMRQFASYKHGTELALARYNAGPARVRGWLPKTKDGSINGLVNSETTKQYIKNIMSRYSRLKAQGQ